MEETINKYLQLIQESAASHTLVKMTLSKPSVKGDDLRNIYVKPVLIKERYLFAFTYHYERRDEVKNYDAEQMMNQFRELLPQRFQNAVLFTLTEDYTLLVNPKGRATIQHKKVQENRESNLDHDKQKHRLLDMSHPWWYQLGLTTREGKLTADMQHKYKQICKYAEIMDPLLAELHLPAGHTLTLADMGAGKGYLTFALYELLTYKYKYDIDIKGVEIRPDLVTKINDIIDINKIRGMRFEENSIAGYRPDSMDVMIALHACNTATDDAIACALRAGSKLIVCAPCCHKQIRQEMESSGLVDAITRYGIFMERQAVMITDTIRAMILEYYGYRTQVMEFIEMENTPKNVLLVGQKSGREVDKLRISKNISDLKKRYGIKTHYLETLMGLNF